jgi:GTP-binding protein
VAIAGLEEIAIGETLADPDDPVALPVIKVKRPPCA